MKAEEDVVVRTWYWYQRQEVRRGDVINQDMKDYREMKQNIEELVE